MNYSRIGVGVAMLVLSANLLVAQQPGQTGYGNQRGMRGDSAMAQQHMHMMDSLNAHLDTLVNRMNTVSGSRKVDAMADVINALVGERRMMQEHMRQMMRSGAGMKRNSSEADSGHSEHDPGE